MRAFSLVLKLIFGCIMMGLLLGFIVPFIINLFSADGLFELWELLLTFVVIIIILVFFVRLLKRFDFDFIQFKFLIITGILTCIMPIGGGLFGETGNEAIWQFMILGIAGSLFWSLPLVVWILISSSGKRI
jgi:hypothetical protein